MRGWGHAPEELGVHSGGHDTRRVDGGVVLEKAPMPTIHPQVRSLDLQTVQGAVVVGVDAVTSPPRPSN